jgi:hypothetical protein
MGKVEKIEAEVKALSPEELAVFRDWYTAYDAQVWDKQIESDAATGKLDKFAAQALADYRAGRAKEI